MITQIKNFPDNEHHDNYSSDRGWKYLGSDERFDYYVNHERKYLSVVFGVEPWDYMSPEYTILISGGYSAEQYHTLRKLIEEST